MTKHTVAAIAAMAGLAMASCGGSGGDPEQSSALLRLYSLDVAAATKSCKSFARASKDSPYLYCAESADEHCKLVEVCNLMDPPQCSEVCEEHAVLPDEASGCAAAPSPVEMINFGSVAAAQAIGDLAGVPGCAPRPDPEDVVRVPAGAADSDAPAPSDGELPTSGCQTVCNLMEPPQCTEVCGDEAAPPASESCVPGTVLVNVVGIDASGEETVEVVAVTQDCDPHWAPSSDAL